MKFKVGDVVIVPDDWRKNKSVIGLVYQSYNTSTGEELSLSFDDGETFPCPASPVILKHRPLNPISYNEQTREIVFPEGYLTDDGFKISNPLKPLHPLIAKGLGIK